MRKLVYAILALGIAACGDNKTEVPANRLFKNDFESLEGWTGGVATPSVTKEKAHSGRYSIKVDPAIEYGFGYSFPLGKVSANRLKKIKVHGWVFLPVKDVSATIVTELKDPVTGKNILWEGIELGKQAKSAKEWTEVEKVIDIPADANFNTTLNVYLWRGGNAQTVYLDDLEVTSEE